MVSIWERKIKKGHRIYLCYRIDGHLVRDKQNIIIYKNDPDLTKKKKVIKELKIKKEYELSKYKYGLAASKTYLLEYFSDYIANCQLASIRKYKGCFKHLSAFTKKDILLKDITLDFSQRFVDSLNRKLSAHGANSYVRCYKKILNMAVSQGVIHKSPAEGVKLKKPSLDFTKEVLLIDEVVLLWKSIDDNLVKRAFIFACYTGVGYAEIKTLNHGNIQDGVLVYNRAKNGILVRVPLRGDLYSLVSNEGLLFDNFPSHGYCQRVIKRWVKEMGISKKISFYSARHSFAVNLLLAGVDIENVRSYLGHTSYQHTMGYVRYVSSINDNKIDKLKGL